MQTNLEKISEPTYTALLNIGLAKGYSGEVQEKQPYVDFVSNYQKKWIAEQGIHLTAAVSEFELIYGGLAEKHLQFRFVNYPLAPTPPEKFKTAINALGKAMMKAFDQNRILIEFPDETIVFQQSKNTDPRI